MFATCNYCFLTLSSPLVKDAVGTVMCLQMDREGRTEGMRILWATAKSAETKSVRLCRESVKPRERKVNSSISTPQVTWFSSRWAILMLVRAQPSTLSWATRKCLCLRRLATPSISRYFQVLRHSVVSLPFHSPCVRHNLLMCLSDSVCGAWPLPVWLPGPGDAVLCVYQSRDDLQWDSPNWPDERSRSTRITNILSVSEPLWFLMCKALKIFRTLPSNSIIVGIRSERHGPLYPH